MTIYTIDSNKHHLETKKQYKIAIDPFDDQGITPCNGEFRFYHYFSIVISKSLNLYKY